MAQFPALPLWTDSYLADTMHLDCVESGAYLHLLIAAWRSPDCMLPDDDKRLARFAKCSTRQWAKIKPVVMAFWTLDEHKWSQKRLLKERFYVTAKREQQSQAGKVSALKRNETSTTNVIPPLQRETNGEATPIPIPIPFNRKEEESALKKIINNSDLSAPTKTLARQVVAYCFDNGGGVELIENMIYSRIAGPCNDFDGAVNRMRGN
jgi:uncharacterized protein YdaU (DUF1376 family)